MKTYPMRRRELTSPIQTLHRQWKLFESFAASFGNTCWFMIGIGLQLLTTSAALYFVGGIRTTFTIGIGAGGPAAYW